MGPGSHPPLEPDSTPPSRPSRSLPLRVLLLLLLIGAVAYVGLFSATLVFRIAPAVRQMKTSSHMAMAVWVTRNELDSTLQDAATRIHSLALRQAEHLDQGPAEIQTVLDTLKRYAQRSWVGDASRALANSPLETRIKLARAMGAESGAINALLDATTDLELGRTSSALRQLQRGDSLRQLATSHLFAIEGPAFISAFEKERYVGKVAAAATGLVWWWAGVGVVLGLWFILVFHRRLYVPLARLEDSLDRVSAGDLSVQVPVIREDEMGRLTRHLNRATAVLRDRTEEERRHALTRIEAERNRIFDLSADLLVTTTLEGQLTRVNPAWARMLGYSQEDSFHRLFSEFVHPEDIIQVDRALDRLRRGAAAREFTVRLRHRDGGYRSISWNCDPPADGFLYGVGRDVTERLETESKQAALGAVIERAAREWSMTFDAIADPVMIVSAGGQVVRINEAARAASGQTHSAVLGRELSAVGTDPLWQRADSLAAEVQATGRPASTQTRSERWRRSWDLEGVPVIKNGQLQVVIIVAHDITALTQLQDSLRRAETMAVMGSLVAGVAHEVRNPLFSMTATLDAFEARHRGRKREEPHLDILRNQLGRLQQLMRDLLEYGKPASLELMELDLADVVKQAVEASAVTAEDAGIQLRIQPDPALPAVQGDRLRLVQVFSNLIVNAVQHSPPAGQVTIAIHSLHQDGRHWLEATVADQGPGFALEALPHVFEPFYTRRRGGTGLGLALVQRILEQHGGTAGAENPPAGGGLLRVRLPLART